MLPSPRSISNVAYPPSVRIEIINHYLLIEPQKQVPWNIKRKKERNIQKELSVGMILAFILILTHAVWLDEDLQSVSCLSYIYPPSLL